MKILNSAGRSPAWIKAAEKYLSEYDRVGDNSVTELNDSPRISMLRRRHEAELEVDVKDLTWMLMGQVIHKILEANASTDSITEQRILVPFAGKQISMKADYIDLIQGTDPPQYCVHDYKITKVFAWKKGVSKSQEAQNNLYRWGYRKHGINCTRGELEMLLKDFSEFDAKISPHDYPSDEVMRVEVPTWPIDKCEEYLKNRIQLFDHAATCADADLPECTLNERWGDPDRFAVKAVVNGKVSDKASPGASKLETREEAQAWINSKQTGKQYVIEFRKGENRRCSGNKCWVRKWCSQWNQGEGSDF